MNPVLAALRILRFCTAVLMALSLMVAGLSLWRAQATVVEQEVVALVPVIDRAAIKDLVQQGKRVIFVDAREEAEFNEEHLPGARNIALRDIKAEKLDELRRADVVIAYCLKDFRGFEVARRLGEAGVGNVKIMQPYGLNGWKGEHLPTAGPSRATDADAWERLMAWSKDTAR